MIAQANNVSDYAEVLGGELPRLMSEVIFGLLGEQDNFTAPPANDDFISCRVAIHGGFEGEVVVSATRALAVCIAGRMFEDELDGQPTLQDARDALREVSNIVAGNLKPLFGENNQLGLPEDQAENARSMPDQLATSTLDHPAGVLRVVVYTTL
ncbi:MAG TPA: chemotaxis protein CheX [Polyangiales bacterium]|nr:chemotaxis protein CheX [Polyangiales bacterium]